MRTSRLSTRPVRGEAAFSGLVLGTSLAASIFAAYAQDRWISWHTLGHSVVLWVVIGIAASTRGTYRRAGWRVTAALTVSVFAYYLAQQLPGHAFYHRTGSGVVVFWFLVASVGGPALAALCVTARTNNPLGIAAGATVLGVLLGDVINARGGRVGLLNNGLTSWIGASMARDPVSVIGLGAALVGVCFAVHRYSWTPTALMTVPAGLLFGYLLVSAPDIVLFRLA
jgi:hypothetical protein